MNDVAQMSMMRSFRRDPEVKGQRLAPGTWRRTTWLHPPGAMPRSTTVLTPFRKPNRSSSSMSL